MLPLWRDQRPPQFRDYLLTQMRRTYQNRRGMTHYRTFGQQDRLFIHSDQQRLVQSEFHIR